MARLYPESVERLIEEFNKMPGVGARSAERLAFHILASPREEAMRLAVAIRDVKQSIRACVRCFNTSEGELCHICSDHNRNASTVCVVELPRDIIALEKCGQYEGVYHVLQGKLDPASGIGPDELRIKELVERIKENRSGEVILALNPTSEGDATANFLVTVLRKEFPNLPVTGLARGLASGTDIESTASSSLLMALKGRQKLEN